MAVHSSSGLHFQHEKLETLIRSAVPSLGTWESAAQSKSTISVDTTLMWEILDFAGGQNSSQRPGRGLYHQSLCDASEPPGSGDRSLLQIRVYHRPNFQVDTSNGGQEPPPHAELSPILTFDQSYKDVEQSQEIVGDETAQDQELRTYDDADATENNPYIPEALDAQLSDNAQLGDNDGSTAAAPPGQEVFMWLGSENVRNNVFADMDFDMNLDPGANLWDSL
jgi:hypothetical protein